MLRDEHTRELEPYLDRDETLYWTGQPRQGFFLRPVDFFLVPFSLLWFGIVIFMFASVIGNDVPWPVFLMLFLFVLIGLFVTIGRFILDIKQRAATYYGLTNRRALIKSGLFKRKLQSVELRTLNEMELTERRDRSGTIRFGPNSMYDLWGGSIPWALQQMSPRFDSIPEAATVHRMIRESMAKR